MLRAPMTSLSTPIQSVLDLFKGPLSSVRFADIDAEGLAHLAAEVEAAASEVERHEVALAELRHSLSQKQEALLVLAQRALAYARVYAEDDEPLLAELSRISLPRPTHASKSKASKSKPDKPNARKPSATKPRAAELAGSPDGASPPSSEGAAEQTEAGAETGHSEIEPGSAGAVEKQADAAPPAVRKGRGSAAQRAHT
jgi:hypothetical protein